MFTIAINPEGSSSFIPAHLGQDMLQNPSVLLLVEAAKELLT